MFLNKNIPDWNLLAKYMAGETNAEESAAVKTWSEQKAQNKALLHEITNDWKKMDMMKAQFNVDNAWNKLHNRIASGNPDVETATVSIKQRKGYFTMTMRIAASLLLLAVLATAIVTTADRLGEVTYTANRSEKGKVIELPDGSTVTLNSNSQLSYTKSYGKNFRDVTLEGEAFFNVTADKNIPFRVYAGNGCVKVLGTSFNVNTRKSAEHLEVYVSTGVVELSDVENESSRMMIHPGNLGILDQKQVNVVKAENANVIAWKTGALVFSDTPLTEAVTLLNNIYDVNITLSGEGIDTIKINGSYQDDTLDNILSVISRHNPQIIIAKSEDTIYLSQ